MMKTALTVSIVAAALSFGAAQAATMTCSDADMMMMQNNMSKMTDAGKKEMAMKEMAMAKESMANKDEKGCMMHMQNMQAMMPN